jgi:acyl carrier protein
MTESENPVFERVREIIAEFTGVDRARITMDSDLCRDLGVAGDDGGDLFRALDDAFEVDWTDLDLGVHFGSEAWSLPFPWHLKNDRVMYLTQPCKVSDIVQAVEIGRWPGTELTLRSLSTRVSLCALSMLLAVVIGGMFLAILWAALAALFD